MELVIIALIAVEVIIVRSCSCVSVCDCSKYFKVLVRDVPEFLHSEEPESQGAKLA